MNKLNVLLINSILYFPKKDGIRFSMSDDDYINIRNIEFELINSIYENEKEKQYIKYLFLNKFVQPYFKVENKIVIKYNTSYNSDIKTEHEISTIKELKSKIDKIV